MSRFVLGLMFILLALLLIVQIPAYGQVGNTSSSDQVSDQTFLDEGSSAAAGSAESQGAIDEAAQMDQLIQTLAGDDQTIAGDDNSAVEGAVPGSGEASGAEDVDQSTQMPEKEVGNTLTDSDQNAGTVNEAGMNQLIQTIAEEDSNGTGESVGDTEIIDEKETLEQPIQTPDGNGGNVETGVHSGQGTLNGTESLNQLIQTLEDNDNASSTITEEVSETGALGNTESTDHLIRILENNGDASTNVGNAQDTNAIEETGLIDQLIQRLMGKNSSIGSETAQNPELADSKPTNEQNQNYAEYKEDSDSSDPAKSDPSLEVNRKSRYMDQMIQALIGS